MHSQHADSNKKKTNDQIFGLSGLCNLGNTCYVNSCMQIISNITDLNKYIGMIETKWKNNGNDIEDVDIIFIKEWKNLYDIMWSRNVTISPNRFIKVMHLIAKEKNNDIFADFSQNDVTEFMYFLFDCFHHGFKKLNDKSIRNYCVNIIENDYSAYESFLSFYKNMINVSGFTIMNAIFDNIYEIQYEHCDDRRIMSTTFEQFTILDIALSSLTLHENIQNHFSKETLEGDNQYHDEKSDQKVNAYKHCKIILPANVLIIQLKRWNHNLRKNQRIIHHDCDSVDLTPYLSNKCPYPHAKYELFGVINHSGNIFGGHYTCMVKKNDKWFSFNDTMVKPIQKASILSNKNYVLFYKRQMT